MSKGYMAEIRRRVGAAEDGTVFVPSDFAGIADGGTVRKCLYDLVRKGTLKRVIPGVFEKPEYSALLKRFVAPDPDRVAYALAREFRWTIAPEGNAALNLLGLSEQVPARCVYVSDGPYRKYGWGNVCIEFRHRAERELTGLSPITTLVVSALKTLGKERALSEDAVGRLSETVSEEDKAVMRKDAEGATGWVYDAVRRICGEDGI